MRIVLTGATGFVGLHLLLSLIETHDVAVLLRPNANKERSALIPSMAVRLVWNGEVTSLPSLLEGFRPDVIVHLASYNRNIHKLEDIDELIASNLRFPTVLLESAVAIGCRQFINTGSFSQHHENANYSPASLYAATKQALRVILTYYLERGGLEKALTLELSDTYGVDDPRPKVIELLKRAAASNELLEMSPGEQFLDLVHVRDVVTGYEQALKLLSMLRTGEHRTYALRSGNPIKLRDLVALYKEISPSPLQVKWGARPYRACEPMEPWTQGETLPGWVPSLTLREGLRSMIESD